MLVFRAALLALTLVLLSSPLGQARQRKNKLPANVLAMLDKADKLELLSLLPDESKEAKNGFHGWEVLGRVEIDGAKVRKQLVEALKKGIQDSDGKAANCFQPRHGLRVTQGGKSVDLVICFACYRISIPSAKGGDVLTTRAPRALFDKVLRDAKVPLPKK